jgi:hypothetical protein
MIAGETTSCAFGCTERGLYSGIYDPSVEVRHLVPASRLTRRYFRRWFYWHGRTMARMADSIYLDVDLDRVPSVWGVPRFVYREFLEQAARWLRRVGRADALELLAEEMILIEYLGFFAESGGKHTAPAARPATAAGSHHLTLKAAVDRGRMCAPFLSSTLRTGDRDDDQPTHDRCCEISVVVVNTSGGPLTAGARSAPSPGRKPHL